MRDGEEENNILILSSGGNGYYIYSISEDKVYGPFALGGSTELCDVVTLGEIAIISRFGDGLFFADVANPNEQKFIKSIDIPGFYEEDIEVTPNGQYVLIADGGGNNRIYVVSLTNNENVSYIDVSGAQAVAITPDGETVFVADYIGNKLIVLNMDPRTGTLTPNTTIEGCTGIMNITVSPDGKTALAACKDKVVVISINSPDSIEKINEITLGTGTEEIQSMVFNPAGDKAYAVSASNSLDTLSVIYELNVTGYGNVSYANRSVALAKTLKTYFGVDQLAISSDGSKAYVGGGSNSLTVVDLSTMSIIKEVQISPSNLSGITIY